MSADSIPDFRGHVSLCVAVVCTSLGDAESAERLNREHPTGISSAWTIAEEFGRGEPNGRPCDESPATHRHLRFVC